MKYRLIFIINIFIYTGCINSNTEQSVEGQQIIEAGDYDTNTGDYDTNKTVLEDNATSDHHLFDLDTSLLSTDTLSLKLDAALRLKAEQKCILKGLEYEKSPIDFIKLLLFGTTDWYPFKPFLAANDPPLSHYKVKYNWTILLSQNNFLDGNNIRSFQSSENSFLDNTIVGYLYNKINRSPENIKRLFNCYRNTILNIISPYLYHNSNLSKYNKALIKTYDCITSHPNYEITFDSIYYEINTKRPKLYPYQLYQYFKPLLCDEIVNEYKREKNELGLPDGEYLDVQWLYSFWLRRYKEGNMEVIYEIFNEVNEYYNNELKILYEKKLSKVSVNKDNVAIRMTPDPKGGLINVLKKNSVLFYLDIRTDFVSENSTNMEFAWAKVQIPESGAVGWIYGGDIDLIKSNYMETSREKKFNQTSQLKASTPELLFNYSGMDVPIFSDKNIFSKILDSVKHRGSVTILKNLKNNSEYFKLHGYSGKLLPIKWKMDTAYVFSGFFLDFPVSSEYFLNYCLKNFKLVNSDTIITGPENPGNDDHRESYSYEFSNGISIGVKSAYESGQTTISIKGFSLQDGYLLANSFTNFFVNQIGYNFPEYPVYKRFKLHGDDSGYYEVQEENGKIKSIIVYEGEGCFESWEIIKTNEGVSIISAGGC